MDQLSEELHELLEDLPVECYCDTTIEDLIEEIKRKGKCDYCLTKEEIDKILKENDTVKRNIPKIYSLILLEKFGRIDYYCENGSSPFLTEYRKETNLEG